MPASSSSTGGKLGRGRAPTVEAMEAVEMGDQDNQPAMPLTDCQYSHMDAIFSCDECSVSPMAF